MALTIFGAGLASFLGKAGSDPLVGEPSREQILPLLRAGTGLADLPVVGPLIFGHDILIYVAWLVAGAASYYLFHTRMRLSLRAVGEDPASAAAP